MVGLSPGVLVHVDSPEVMADGEEEGKVVAGDHQHWQDVQHGRDPAAGCEIKRH